MRNRSPILVLLFVFITFGIYGIYWAVSTKGEMNQQGAQIPTAWLLLVPIVSIWWFWKYCQGVDQTTKGALSGVVSFILLILLGAIGMAIVQSSFNKTAAA